MSTLSMKRLLTVVLLFLLPLCLFAQKQGQAYIDSCVQELTSDSYRNKEDTNKVKLLIGIAQRYIRINPDNGIKYGQEALALSDKLGWDAGKANSNYILAWIYRSQAAYAKALECCNKALEISQRINDKQKIALVYQIMSIIRIDQSDYPQALELSLKSLKISEEIQDKRLMGGNLTNIGIIYDDQGDLGKAMEQHTKALKIFEGLNDKLTVATSLSNIGLIYKEQKDYGNALETLFKALKIGEELGNKHTISKVHGYIGDVYIGAKNYSKALEYLNIAEKIDEELGDKSGCAEKLQSIGLAYLAMTKDSSSQSKDAKSTNNAKLHNLAKAIEYFSQSAAIHKQIGNIKDLSENYRDLSTSFELSGNYKDALENHKQYMINKDSVFSQQNKEKLKKLEIKRDIELKDKQIQIDKLEVAKKRNESIFYISGILLLLLVIVFMYRNYNLQKRSNALLSKEKKISEDLLLNILPSEVANELKEKGSAEAKYFDNVTVLLTDFVNFSSAGEQMSPQELVNELDVCFKAFDNIIGKYSIEKIKTIGDAYLAVAGLPLPDEHHAVNTLYAAIEINSYIQNRRKQLGNKAFEVRIGIHSGSIVAGIVGLKKFAYDIWGDTVNVAARMEQHSEPGKINISQTTYDLIKDKFTCTCRGEIEAKNKGKLGMYFVEGTL